MCLQISSSNSSDSGGGSVGSEERKIVSQEKTLLLPRRTESVWAADTLRTFPRRRHRKAAPPRVDTLIDSTENSTVVDLIRGQDLRSLKPREDLLIRSHESI